MHITLTGVNFVTGYPVPARNHYLISVQWSNRYALTVLL